MPDLPPRVRVSAARFRLAERVRWLLLVAALAVYAARWYAPDVAPRVRWVVWTLAAAFVVLRQMRWVIANPPPTVDLDDPTYVVTLVHGTFALDAPWTHADSALCRTLPGLIGDDRVGFVRFQWTGGNRMRDRDDAADELVPFLDALGATYPNARHVVVAHSHGGNVARRALARLTTPGSVELLVCLSTPFLTVQPRALGPHGILALRGVLSAAIVAALMLTLDRFPAVSMAQVMEMSEAVIKVWLAVIAVGDGLTFFKLAPFLIERLRRRALAVLAREPRDVGTQTVILRATSDEASMTLLAMGFAAWLGELAWRGTTYFAGWFAPMLGWVVRPLVQSDPWYKRMWHTGSAEIVVGATAILGLSAVGVVAIVPLLAALLCMEAAGVGLGLESLLLDVSTDSAPVGVASVVTLGTSHSLESLDLTSLRPGSAEELAHSVYSRAEVLDWIGTWVNALPARDGA